MWHRACVRMSPVCHLIPLRVHVHMSPVCHLSPLHMVHTRHLYVTCRQAYSDKLLTSSPVDPGRPAGTHGKGAWSMQTHPFPSTYVCSSFSVAAVMCFCCAVSSSLTFCDRVSLLSPSTDSPLSSGACHPDTAERVHCRVST